jgi:hypothetical protein
LTESDSPNIWDVDSPEWLDGIIVSLLEVGVPPTAIARAFRIDQFAIKERQSQLHISQYGTAEISEAMNFLMWRAYQDALSILDSAPSATRTRFITTLLSRQSIILGKESPQSLERMRDELNNLVSTINVPDPITPSIYQSSQYTPATVDGDTDDPEEGFES